MMRSCALSVMGCIYAHRATATLFIVALSRCALLDISNRNRYAEEHDHRIIAQLADPANRAFSAFGIQRRSYSHVRLTADHGCQSLFSVIRGILNILKIVITRIKV